MQSRLLVRWHTLLQDALKLLTRKVQLLAARSIVLFNERTRGRMKVKPGHLFTGIALALLGIYFVFSVLIVMHILVVPLQILITVNVFAGFVIAAVGLSRWVSKPGKSAREIWIVAISALIFALPILFLLMRW